MLTRRALFKFLGRGSLGIAAVPLLAKYASAVVFNDGKLPYWKLIHDGESLSLAEIVKSTLRSRSGKLAENVVMHNALFDRLKERL